MKTFVIGKKFKNVMILAFRKGMKKFGTEITFCEAAEIIDTYKTFNNLPDFVVDFLTDYIMDLKEGNENITYKINYDNENIILSEIPEAEEIPTEAAAAEDAEILETSEKVQYISGAHIKKGMLLKTIYNTWGAVIDVTENSNSGGHNYILRDQAGRVDLRYINQYSKVIQLVKPAAAQETAAAEDVDQENKIYYINDILNTLNKISIDNYIMNDGGRGSMYKLNNTYSIILTPYKNGVAYDEIIAAEDVDALTMDVYKNGNLFYSVDGAEEISEYITADIIPFLNGPEAADLEALKWDYENSINYIIEGINGRVLSADGINKIYIKVFKEAEKLELYRGENLYKTIEGYINIMNCINNFIADYFSSCGNCGASGEMWDGKPCKICAGTGLKLK